LVFEGGKDEICFEPGKEGFKDDQDQVCRWIKESMIYLLGNVCPIPSILKSFLSWFKTKKRASYRMFPPV